jgi:hypothetical protein
MDTKMDADWEVEIGGGAPVIEAQWPGFIDLREYPERIGEIAEATAFPPLADLLIRLNSPGSCVWTSKCDVWEPEPGGLACYVDFIPHDESIFAEWPRTEGLCRALVESLAERTTTAVEAAGRHPILVAHDQSEREATVTLVVRQAIAGQAEGFGITAYFSAGPLSVPDAKTVISDSMAVFSKAIQSGFPARPRVNAKIEGTGE